MRFSEEAKLKVRSVSPGERDFFDVVRSDTHPDERVGGLLFVGGCGPRDIVVRNAQSVLRMDRLPSYWSHVAIVVDWPDDAGHDRARGVEASLAPEDPSLQVPERNGVTLFRLGRYADRSWYPNLAFATILGRGGEEKGGAGASKPQEARKRLLDAVRNPNRERVRFPIWDWIGQWSAFSYSGLDNPLLRSISHPAAALCEYAYEAAGLDLTPGATEANAAPETLWSTLLYWHVGLDPGKEALRIWKSLDEDAAPTRTPLGPQFDDLGAPPRAAKRRPRPQRR